MKRSIRLFVTAVFMTVLFSMTAFGAGWATGQGENSGRWWYDLGDGTWYAGTQGTPSWQWLDGTLFEIHPAEAYPSSYSATTQRAQREISAGTLPEKPSFLSAPAAAAESGEA